MNRREMLEKAQALFAEAKGLLEQETIDAEDAERRDRLLMEAKDWQTKAGELKEIEQAALEFKAFQEDTQKGAQPGEAFKTVGEWMRAVHRFYDPRYRYPIPELGSEFSKDDDEPDQASWLSKEAQEHKDLVESVGASGGFLVPIQFVPELLGVVYEENPIRARATVIRMSARQLNMPTLDQTGTTAGETRQHGGIVASWTEEAKAKAETEPSFRQINLVAHKLVCYTEVSDELLADEAVGLVSFLQSPMGFAGAIRWEEEYTFLQGTGAGQPLGVLNAAATITVAPAAAAAIGPADLFNMLSVHHGDEPCWHISRSAMPQLLALNGPAANPSYIFIPNARDGAPGTLFGFPIYYTEKLPALGTAGGVLLADWNYYLIGDRQATTIDSSMHYRFQYDLTAWRAVHRVDGQPWLSAPLTLADGATQISPFVILGAVAS